jgi:hypothetical protein
MVATTVSATIIQRHGGLHGGDGHRQKQSRGPERPIETE